LNRRKSYSSTHKRKNNRRFTLIAQRSGTTQIKRRSITSGRLFFLFSIALLVVISLLSMAVITISEWRVRIRTGELISENQLLDYELSEIKDRLNTVIDVVDSLAVEEEHIRIRVNLPPLGEEVRQAGIGSMLPLENKVIGDERVEELLVSLDQIERELSIQRQSFGEIQQTIVTNEERLLCIPSILPINNSRFTDPFGWRPDPFTGQRRFHYGVDFSSPTGTPIYATADGRVTKARRAAGYGKVIKIDHGYGFVTVYGHLNDYNVKRGQRVKRGDVIGYCGNTGRSTAPHVHYEVQVNDRPVNPLDYFYEGYEIAGNRK